MTDELWPALSAAPPAVEAGLATAAATTTEVARPPDLLAEPEPEPEPEAEPEPPAVPTGRGRALLAAAGTALVAVLAGVVLYSTGPVADGRAARRLAARRADALAESRQLALNLVSIDYRTLDRDLKRIADSTTGKARSEFDSKIVKNETYKDLVKENHAVLTSTILRMGLEPCGADDAACRRGDRAVVLAFLDQESTNKLRTTPRVDRNRVALTLVRQGDRWLVSEVAVL